jgi:crotonobetainyl-CoA:carnitine CoA-transferase CaiB-like acyl-CoA transferase
MFPNTRTLPSPYQDEHFMGERLLKVKMEQINSPTALSRFRVLDLSRVRAGPTCVRMLADFGADVIRVEPPAGVDPNEAMFAADRMSGDFQNLNRNKRSLTLNLKKPEGLEVFKRLVKHADVVVENWRPDVKKRLGVDYETLRHINPRIVLASISGFGQDGPYAWRPGFDQIIQGMGGLMSVTGLPGQGPVRAGLAVADSSSGLYTAIGILIALLEREVSGHGQWVHSSLLHSLIAMMDFQAARYLTDGAIPEQVGNDHPTSSPMGLFPAADGMFNIGASGEGNWKRFCEALGKLEWMEIDAFKNEKLRVKNRVQLSEMISTLFKTHTVEHWVELLNRAGVPAGPVYTIPQVFEDPQVLHLKAAQEIKTPQGPTVQLITQPVTLERTPATIATSAPSWGEHTNEVLREAGYGDQEIAELRAKGVI